METKKVTKLLFVSITGILTLILISNMIVGTTQIKCQKLYFFDNINRTCNMKNFCGVYMYPGLNTFKTFPLCKAALVANSTGNESYQLCIWKNDANKITCNQNASTSYKSCLKSSTKSNVKTCIANYSADLKVCNNNYLAMQKKCKVLK